MASRCIFFQRGGAREHVREKISSFSRLHVCVFLSWCMYVSSLFKEAHHLPNIFSLTYVRSDVSRTVVGGPEHYICYINLTVEIILFVKIYRIEG